MRTDSDRLRLYSEITQCPLHCKGIVNDCSVGLVPRGFFWGRESSDVTLLIVSQNPANAPAWESGLYSHTRPEKLAAVHLEVGGDLFRGTKCVPGSYHVNLVRRVAAVLGVEPTVDAVFRHTALTALVKCQSQGAKTGGIPDQTNATCAERFLLREIALFQPVYLLALGKTPYDFLTKAHMVRRHGLKVGKLWHPSWTNMPGGEAAYFARDIPALRQEYVQCLRAAGRSPI